MKALSSQENADIFRVCFPYPNSAHLQSTLSLTSLRGAWLVRSALNKMGVLFGDKEAESSGHD